MKKAEVRNEEVPVRLELPVIKCGKCNQEFVVIAVIPPAYAEGIKLGSVYFCPFCGAEKAEG